ncbi:tape measure protein [Limosilactobacillus reuteri]
MAVYGTNIDINVIGNAIDQLQKIRADYERIKQNPGKDIKVGVEDHASQKLNETEEKIRRLPSRHDTHLSVSGTEGILGSLNRLRERASSTFSSIRSDMHKTGESAHRLRDIIAGTAIGQGIFNGVSTALGTMKNGILGAVKAGFEYNAEMDKMNATWTTLTGSAGKADKMTKSIVNLSNTLGQSVGVTDELAQQFYHVFDNQPETEKLTKSFLTMGDAIGLSGDRLTQVGMDFTHMLSASTLHIGELNQITDAFPMFGGALLDYERKVQHSSSLTMNELRRQISAGKISAKDAEAVMNELGDKYKKASDNLMGTLPGMLRQIKAEGQGLLGAMVDPLNKAVNPIMKQVSKWVADDRTKKEFSKLGNAANVGVAAVMQAFANAFGNGSITQMLDNMVNGLTDTVTKFSDWLARNGTSIVKIFASIGSIAKSVGTGFVDALSDFLHLIPGVHSEGMKGIADAFSEIAKHKTALQIIGRIWATYFVTSKIMGAAKAMNELYKNMLAITTLSKVQSPTGSLLGDIGYLNSGRVRKVADASATTRLARYGNLEKQGVKIAPYLDERGFKASWSRFTNKLPILGSRVGEQTGTATSRGLLTKFAGGLTGLESLGKGIAGKLGAGIAIVLSTMDLARGLTPSFKGDRVKEIGKGAGGLIGAGLLSEFGPGGIAVGATVGNMIGGGISKGIWGILKGMYHFGYDLGEVLQGKMSFHTMVGKFQKSFSGMMSWAGKEWDKFKHWWNDDQPSSSRSTSHRSKQPSKQVVESLGENNYSKQDIANVKEMNKAITTYTGSLKKLKASIKENDPTKQLNGMNSRLEKSIKSWDKLASPIKKIGKSFDELKSFNKSMTKDDAFAKLSKDIPKLDKALKSNQIAKNIKKISTELKKDNLTKTLDKMNASLNRDSKYWNALAKPIKTTANSFNVMRKSLKDFEGKHNPLDRLESSVKSLTKTVRRYQFGKELSKQMSIADKSMSGKHSFVNGFVSRTKQVESELRRFRTSFNRDWKNSWTNMDVYPSRAMNSVRSTVSSRLSSIESRERGFTSSFLSGWRRWTSSVVSEMRSSFNKLPGIAERAMSGIVSRLNRGISSINSVISDFGGDKKLSAVHYANGTGFSGAHPGGLAVINDGDTRHKQELVWQPSQGWKLFSGLNRMVTLEPGAQVLPSELSHHVLSAINVPHYADGTLSDEEEDKIAEQFIDNPVKASRDLVLKFTNWNSGAPIIPSFGRATAIGFSRGIANVLKDLLGIIKEPRNGDWTPVIKSAARLMHVHLSEGQIGKLLRQIQTESGGNEKITQQISDVNSAAGHPAQGLLQFIPSTFNTWAMPGHHNLLSGFDQIMAAINALNHGGEGGWGNVGNGHGWANGGHLLQPDYGWVAEDGDEYIINPNKPNAMQLATEAISDILNRNPNLGAVRPTLANSQYQPAISPVTQTNITAGNNNVMVNLVKQVVEKLDNINIHPRITVEDMAKPIDKYNAAKFSLRRR